MSKEDYHPGRSRFAAVLVPEAQELRSSWAYYSLMLQGFSDALLDARLFMRLVPCLHDYQREHFLSALRGQYAGLVFLGPMYVYEDFIRTAVKYCEGPAVMLDHHFDGIPMHSVREDAVAGMRAVAGHLIGLGHEHIAYLDHEDRSANPWKRQGLNEALRKAGLPELKPGWAAGCRYNLPDAAVALDWFLELEPRPTAVACCDDGHALLMIQAAAQRGLEVPGDLSVAGYGDFAALRGRSKALTSAAVDPVELGRRAAELVAAPPSEPAAALVAPRLVVRETTAPPAGG